MENVFFFKNQSNESPWPPLMFLKGGRMGLKTHFLGWGFGIIEIQCFWRQFILNFPVSL